MMHAITVLFIELDAAGVELHHFPLTVCATEPEAGRVVRLSPSEAHWPERYVVQRTEPPLPGHLLPITLVAYVQAAADTHA
jgi:hypothetical protein